MLVTVDTQHADQSFWVAFEHAVAGIYHKPMYPVKGECAGSGGSNPTVEECVRVQVARISRQLRVFLSYAHKDEVVAVRLLEALTPEGYETFNAQTSLRAGEGWLPQIQEQIAQIMERGVFIVLLSTASIASPGVEAQVQYGFSKMA